MKTAAFVLVPFLAGAAGVGAGVIQGSLPNTEVVGHVNEPDKIEPTAERLAALSIPDGFRLTRFASIENPRLMCVDSVTGYVYVSSRDNGTVSLLRDLDNDGVADTQQIVFRRKNSHGLAIRGRELWIVTARELWKNPIAADGTLGKPQLVLSDLPDAGQHNNRSMNFGPDGMLYVSVGSTCNECEESNPENATILRVNPDSGDRTIYASGLRNTIGFGWHPVSGKMFGMDHGTDWLGDEEQPEELNEIQKEARYGWPYLFGWNKPNPHRMPPPPFTVEGWKAMSKGPLLGYVAHSAPMQMAFSTGTMFPREYRNDGFQAMRGSWNRAVPTGYEVVRVHYTAEGVPEKIEPFLSGFVVRGGGKTEGKDGYLGRLCGLVQAKDGALLLSDDSNNEIYRVSYGNPPASAPDHDALTLTKFQAPASLTVKASTFTEGGTIPLEHSEYGAKKSPSLSWSGVPSTAKSIVILCEDPDALSPKPFVHWLVANVPATQTTVAMDLPKQPSPPQLTGGIQGSGSSGVLGWFGPKPPAADPAHAYHFEVLALDTTFPLKPGFTRAWLTRAIQGHVVAKGEIVGKFKKEG